MPRQHWGPPCRSFATAATATNTPSRPGNARLGSSLYRLPEHLLRTDGVKRAPAPGCGPGPILSSPCTARGHLGTPRDVEAAGQNLREGAFVCTPGPGLPRQSSVSNLCHLHGAIVMLELPGAGDRGWCSLVKMHASETMLLPLSAFALIAV